MKAAWQSRRRVMPHNRSRSGLLAKLLHRVIGTQCKRIWEIDREACAVILSADSPVPRGRYWLRDGQRFVAVDTSTGEIHIRQFQAKRACARWLRSQPDTGAQTDPMIGMTVFFVRAGRNAKGNVTVSVTVKARIIDLSETVAIFKPATDPGFVYLYLEHLNTVYWADETTAWGYAAGLKQAERLAGRTAAYLYVHEKTHATGLPKISA